MIHCPECGAEHLPGTLFCDDCGAGIHPATRAHPAEAAPHGQSSPTHAPPPATPQPAALLSTASSPPASAAPRDIRFRLPHHDVTFTVRGTQINIGRADPDDGFFPEVDFTTYGGQERGVSRRHAVIQWVEGGYVLIDQHSNNGTWLDGVQMVAGYAYQIPPGATVRFGGLLVQLTIAN